MSTPSAGLLAAAFIGIVPGYISRSVAGSYDNEAIAIFLLMSSFYSWIKAVKTGSSFWGMITALFYGWMVAAWGGYVFITNSMSLNSQLNCYLLFCSDSTARLCSHCHGQVQQPALHRLLFLVCHWNYRLHAGSLCGVPPHPNF